MTERLQNISVVRVAAMVLIVYYHCLCCYTRWSGKFFCGVRFEPYGSLCNVLYDYHVPAFALIAGFLFGYIRFIRGGYNDIFSFVKKKTERILLPYIIVGLFLCLIDFGTLRSMYYGISHLWFLISIFGCFILFRLIDFIFTPRSSVFILVFVYVGFFFGLHNIRTMVPLPANFIYLSFYYAAGVALSRLTDLKIMGNSRLLFGLLAASVILYLIDITLYHRGRITILLALNVIILTLLYLRTVKRNMMNSAVISLDKASMGIYIVHHILIQAVVVMPFMHDFITRHYVLFPHLLFVITLPASYFIVVFMQRYSWSKYIIG